MKSNLKTVLVTGGAGYVGSALIPKLLDAGHRVKVIDLYIYGENIFDAYKNNPNLEQVKGDIRDAALLKKIIPGCDAVIHLACISNDPSFELNPTLGKAINLDAFGPLVKISKESGVKRFVYASSSSVYGVKATPNVTEDLPLEPLTDYSKFKAMCEDILLKERRPGFAALILRPATVCGYAPRLRLDLTVNILTNHALNNRKITVFGGKQMRPNIHMDDVCDLYLQSLVWPDEKIDGKIFNAGYENHTVMQLAETVKKAVGGELDIVVKPTEDNRSYHISSEKIKKELGFVPKRTIEDAVRDLVAAFKAGKVPNSLTDSRYFNIKRMQELALVK
jgi:nucleoside-diphosphate-sugar epimerase